MNEEIKQLKLRASALEELVSALVAELNLRDAVLKRLSARRGTTVGQMHKSTLEVVARVQEGMLDLHKREGI